MQQSSRLLCFFEKSATVAVSWPVLTSSCGGRFDSGEDRLKALGAQPIRAIRDIQAVASQAPVIVEGVAQPLSIIRGQESADPFRNSAWQKPRLQKHVVYGSRISALESTTSSSGSLVLSFLPIRQCCNPSGWHRSNVSTNLKLLTRA